MDKDGTNSDYDLELIQMVKEKVTIPQFPGTPYLISKIPSMKGELSTGIFKGLEVPITGANKQLRGEVTEIRDRNS